MVSSKAEGEVMCYGSSCATRSVRFGSGQYAYEVQSLGSCVQSQTLDAEVVELHGYSTYCTVKASFARPALLRAAH